MSVPETYFYCCRTYYEFCRHFPPGIYHASESTNSPAAIYEETVPPVRAARAARPILNRVHTGRKITTLPVEILELITTFLSPADASSFALASQYLAQALGQRAWARLKCPENWYHRYKFLVGIREDNEILCDVCGVLHRSQLPGNAVTSAMQRAMRGESKTFGFGYRVTQGMIRLAIERLQNGFPHGMCPELLSCAGIVLEVQRRVEYAYRARVVDGELLLRLDVRFHNKKFKGDTTAALYQYRKYLMCNHNRSVLQLLSSPVKKLFSRVRQKQERHYKAPYPYTPTVPSGDACTPGHLKYPEPSRVRLLHPRPTRGPSIHCRDCHYVLIWNNRFNGDTRNLQGNVLIRSYLNLGSGKPGDMKWRRIIDPAGNHPDIDTNTSVLLIFKNGPGL